MPDIARLRKWIGFAAIALVVVVAGFYVYARYRVQQVLREVPKKLGVEVQQSTEGFSLSKSEGGRTLFTIRASKAIQFKQGGRAELHEVNIVVYGRNANRFDQIYGAVFEYDPRSGDITARGEVHIDLEADVQGPQRPDQAPPQELKNPIHLKTSGLVFNQKTGYASTQERVEFRIPQASGSAMGATYESKANLLSLRSDVRINTTGSNPSTIIARSAAISKDPRQAVLEAAHVEQPSGTLDADQVTVLLRPDNNIERVLARGDVRGDRQGKEPMHLRTSQAELFMGERNTLRSAVLSGGVAMNTSGERLMQGTAGRVTVDFNARAKNQVSKVHAAEDVKLVQRPNPRQKGPTQIVEVEAPALDAFIKDGKHIERAQTLDAARIIITPQQQTTTVKHGVAAPVALPTAGRTVITASIFQAGFDRNNRLSTLHGAPDSKIVSFIPPTATSAESERVSTSRNLDVVFKPDGGLASVVQEGDFHYQEGTRQAWSQKASYTASDEMLVFTGSSRVVDGGMTTTAESVRLNRASGDTNADGEVKTTYSELKAQAGGALLAASDPVHVTAKSMTARRATGVARYLGNARLWQGTNIVQAPIIDFDREHRTVRALGTESDPVACVFVQQENIRPVSGSNPGTAKGGKTTPVNVTASRLTYADSQRKARFDGGVTVKGADGTLTAGHADVFLQPREETLQGKIVRTADSPVSTPSQIDRIVAEGQVRMQQPNRRGNGERLVYTAAERKFVLTGGPPSIFDAERGSTTGDSLTFFSGDDKVLVQSKNSRAVTQTRVAK